mgnify:FL=1
MNTKTQLHALVTMAMLAATAIVLTIQKEHVMSDATDLAPELPAVVGDHTGSTLLFCQNELCNLSIRPVEDHGQKVCADCGKHLDLLSLGEMRMLPPDTRLAKKRYVNARGEVILASIVTTGNERKSIHRPEVCLPAQGFVIESSTVVPVVVQGRAPLEVRLLLIRSTGRNPKNPAEARFSSFAYWFAGGGQETSSHLVRIFLSSLDRVLHNVVSRWSYVAVSTDRLDPSDDASARIATFIGDLYPLISTRGEEPPDTPASK